MQVARGMMGISIIVSGCVIFLRLPLANRTVPLLFILIGTVVLLAKERLIAARLRRRAVRGVQREPVLLAGLPQDFAATAGTFNPHKSLILRTVGREYLHEHATTHLLRTEHRTPRP